MAAILESVVSIVQISLPADTSFLSLFLIFVQFVPKAA